MARPFSHVLEDLARATSSMESVSAAISEFQAACISGDEKMMDCSRAKALGSLDSYLDNIAAAHIAKDQ